MRGDAAEQPEIDPEVDPAVASVQAAARQLITAARTLLDAAEVALADPRVVADAVTTLSAFAQEAARLATEAARRVDLTGSPSAGGDGAGTDDGPGDAGVQHIVVD